MTDFRNDPRGQPVDEATMTTGVLRGVQQLESLAPPPVANTGTTAPDQPAYRKEPLFSKKVLFGWAFATLAIWFAFSFIVPAVVTAVKNEVLTHMTPGTSRTVITTKDGRTVTIIRTKDGITIDRRGPDGTAVAAPVQIPIQTAPTPLAPGTPVPAPEQPAAPAAPTGKK